MQEELVVFGGECCFDQGVWNFFQGNVVVQNDIVVVDFFVEVVKEGNGEFVCGFLVGVVGCFNCGLCKGQYDYVVDGFVGEVVRVKFRENVLDFFGLKLVQ